MYGCKSWMIKKAQCQRIDAFKLWCWRRLLSPLDSKEIKPVNLKGNQPWIFIARIDAEAEVSVLWSSDGKSQLTGKDPDAGKDWGQEEKGLQRMRWLDDIIDTMDMNLSKLWETVKDREAWHSEVAESQTGLSDWTTTITPKAQATTAEINKWDYIKVKSFWSGWNEQTYVKFLE